MAAWLIWLIGYAVAAGIIACLRVNASHAEIMKMFPVLSGVHKFWLLLGVFLWGWFIFPFVLINWIMLLRVMVLEIRLRKANAELEERQYSWMRIKELLNIIDKISKEQKQYE